MKYLTYISFLWLSVLTSFVNFNEIKTTDAENFSVHESDSISTILISAVGDLMCHSVQFNYSKTDNGNFDFNGVFREIRRYLSGANLTIGNLETVIAGIDKKYSGYPFFNSPDEFLSAIAAAGFDLLTTANNHALDRGVEGLKRTIEKIRDEGMNCTGTFLSEADRDSVRIFYRNDFSIAVLAYSYGTNGILIPQNLKYIINLIDEELISRDIASARNSGAEIVIVHFHFGNEYQRYPDQHQIDVVNSTINAGADIILADHPHVIQPVKFFKPVNKKLDRGIVAFSLGNFISNQRWRYSDAGIILQLRFSKNINTGFITLSEVSYTPTWVYKGNTGIRNEYIILPLNENQNYSSYPFLTDSDISKMKQAFEDTQEIISYFTDDIYLYRLPEILVRPLYKGMETIPHQSFIEKINF
ncbi:MAG: CapA family protein [Ignavibacteriaceae bacterium]